MTPEYSRIMAIAVNEIDLEPMERVKLSDEMRVANRYENLAGEARRRYDRAQKAYHS